MVISAIEDAIKLKARMRLERSLLKTFVCGVDLGINNAATASIVGQDGTVKARAFINPARDIDRRNFRRMMISHKVKQTKNITTVRSLIFNRQI